MVLAIPTLLLFVLWVTQPPPASLSQEQSPVIKVTTRSVQVSVAVQDKKGDPVTDLKKEDFLLYDKGQEQQIRYFAVEKYERPRSASALPAGVYSNRLANVNGHAQPMPNTLTVILLDGLNTAWADQAMAKQGLVKFLDQLRPGDQVAIYTLDDSGLQILHDFTSDTAALLRDLARHRGVDSALLAGSKPDSFNTGQAGLDRLLARRSRAQVDFYHARESDATLDALLSIANHLAGMPGRKNLIWVSDGYPAFVNRDYLSMHDDMRRTVAAINATGLAIYPVDAKGLNPVDAMPAQSPTYATPSGRRSAATGPPNIGPVVQLQSTMMELADSTGGRASLNNNDIAGAIRRAINDGNFTYTLAYSPTHSEWDGKYRDIKVTVKRAGVEAHYRKGYLATPEVADDPDSRKATLAEATDSPLLFTGMGLLAKVSQPPTVDSPHARLRLVMDFGDINFRQDTRGLWIADLDIITVVRDANGKSLKQLVHTMHVAVKQAQYDEYRKEGVGLNVDVDAPIGAVRARVAVHDLSNGALGSVDLPFAEEKPEIKPEAKP
jgi:VWFA-related protein